MPDRPNHFVRQPVAFRWLITAGALLLANAILPAPRAAGQAAGAPDILVNATQTDHRAETTTLAEAVALATADPRDNRIVFDPAVFKDNRTTITLETPLVVSQAAGDDRIDASLIPRGLTIDASRCVDAGLIVAGEARLSLSRIAFVGGGQRAILAKDEAQITLGNVAVTRAGGPGIALFGRARLALDHAKITANETHGIELHGRASAVISNAALLENRQSAIAAFDESHWSADRVKFDHNADWNIVLNDRSKATCTNSQLLRARFANADISGASQFVADNCTLSDGERFGLFVTGEARIELKHVVLSGHKGRGIELQGNAAAVLSDSRVEASGDYGAIAFGSGSLTATDSAFVSNGAHGVSLRDKASGIFRECTFEANQYSGVGCLDASNGGKVLVSRCLFMKNRMRPIYRGPLHIDPVTPTPLAVRGRTVECVAGPGATVELYLDRVGEASRYLRTLKADRAGRFRVDTTDVPHGWVMTASATEKGSTSEFNVIAGTNAGAVTCALLSRTGRLSDDGAPIAPAALLRRWRRGTHLTFHIENPPTEVVRTYAEFLAMCVPEWTNGAVTADIRLGDSGRVDESCVLIPIRYLEPDVNELVGRGGITYMKWDAYGYFVEPMRIILATGKPENTGCPRVLAHEIGHTLGLCHARVGLLSRMQGAAEPAPPFINDFSPMLTYYDVASLQVLYDRRNGRGATLGHLVRRGVIPVSRAPEVAAAPEEPAAPTFSPPVNEPVHPSEQ